MNLSIRCRTLSLVLLTMLFLLGGALAQRTVSCPLQNQPGEVQADLYGSGTHGLLLAHGGQFHKESWAPQAQVFAQAGFLVLAVSFRGDHLNPDGSPGSFGKTEDNVTDVLAGIACLQHAGAKTIYAVGASMGGDAIGEANARSAPGVLARSVFLGSAGGDASARLSGRKLFLLARHDRSGSGPRLPEISSHYAQAPQPKQLILVKGSAHAQFLFATPQGTAVLNDILHFLSAP